MDLFKGPYTYLILNILTIAFPLLLSFDKKVAFYQKWKFFLPAMVATGIFFIVWDVWFTNIGVWSFNPDYLTGIYILNLPLEEWLFFVTIPYACTFIYECIRCWFTLSMSRKTAFYLSLGLSALFLIIGLTQIHRYYTAVTFLTLGFFFPLQFVLFKQDILRNFIPAFLLSLLPFFIVNGVLTANPVVIYNDMENLGFRLTTIPVEDIFYGMLLILMNITLMEVWRQRIFVRPQKLNIA